MFDNLQIFDEKFFCKTAVYRHDDLSDPTEHQFSSSLVMTDGEWGLRMLYACVYYLTDNKGTKIAWETLNYYLLL